MFYETPTPLVDHRKILVVLHRETATAGRVGRLLQEWGYELDIRYPCLGQELPKHMEEHRAAIFFGGPMSVNDNDEWIKKEIDWINLPLEQGKPFLGICLGSQMLAKCLGAKVSAHPDGRVEAGYYPIHVTPDGHSVCSAHFPDHVYHWHEEGFECPQDATLLAIGSDFETQGIRVGERAYGFQFHPEVTYAMMCRWTNHSHRYLGQPGATERERHLQGWFQHDQKVATWIREFLKCWVGHHHLGSGNSCRTCR